jgi:hypothetical protein
MNGRALFTTILQYIQTLIQFRTNPDSMRLGQFIIPIELRTD